MDQNWQLIAWMIDGSSRCERELVSHTTQQSLGLAWRITSRRFPDTSYLVAVLQQRSHYQSVGLIDLEKTSS